MSGSHFNSEIDRRTFLASTAALAIGHEQLMNSVGEIEHTTKKFSTVGALEPRGKAWPDYDRVIVIDFLASPGYFNYPLNPPLNDSMIANAIESGITAVNLTVSGSDFAGTVQNIAGWMDRIERYPEAFSQVRTLDQLLAAKQERRLGIVFGFQDTTPFEGGLDEIEIFLNLGVKVTQLTYNIRNLAGDGCL